MPVYLLHGFRWPRALIRIHIILQNLDDAAAEWLCQPQTTEVMLDNFRQLYPDCMLNLPNLRFIEQYDPEDVSSDAISQPYAYVADTVEEIKLGAEVDEIRGKGLSAEQWESIMDLRDKVAPDEKVAWWVVVCGDEERWVPPLESEDDASVYSDVDEMPRLGSSDGSMGARYSLPSRVIEEHNAPAPAVQPLAAPSPAVKPSTTPSPAVQPPTTPSKASPGPAKRDEEARGFRKLFSSSGRSKSKTPTKRKRYVEVSSDSRGTVS